MGPEDPRYPTYAKRAIEHFGQVALPAKDAAADEAKRAREEHLVARYLTVELHRRSGSFDAAKHALGEIAKLDQADAPDWYARAVAFQATLVDKRDRAPHEFREMPPPEDEEKPAEGEEETEDEGEEGP